MLFAMVPMVPVANAVLVSGNIDFVNQTVTYAPEFDKAGEKGHTIECHGDPNSVASGYEVSLYWDKIQSWDGKKGHLNTTDVDDDGGFEIWFTVPQASEGYHYLWFTATDQETKVQVKFRIVTDTDLSTSSGLAGAKILVDLWGYDDSEDIAIVFAQDGDAHNWGTYTAANDVIYTYTTADLAANKKVFTGLQFRYYPVARSGTTPVIYVNSGGVTQIAHWDGAAWVADTGLFTSATLTDTTGKMTLTLSANLVVDDTIEVDYTAASSASIKDNEDQDEATNAEDKKYDGRTSTGMIIPKTFSLQYGAVGADIATDALGDGKLAGAGVTSGSIDYVTGEWSITFAAAPGSNALYADYVCVKTITNYVHVLTTTVTNDVGTIEDRRVTIPSGAAEGAYKIVGFDGDSNNATATFTIGATITLDTDTGEAGDKIEITGEGFPALTELQCELTRGTTTWVAHIIGSKDTAGADKDETNAYGEFTFDIIVPDTDKKDDDFKIHVWGGGYEAEASFEVTGLTSVSVDPYFGPQGSTITVSGENFQNIKAKTVDITLTTTGGAYVADIKKGVKVESDGSFEADVTVPTENDGPYTIKVADVADEDGTFNIDDSKEFRIGTILILLSKDEAVVGDKIVLTGNGFTDGGEWNATFGDVTIFDDEHASGTGLLKVGSDTPEFFVPQLEPGVYTILVWDVAAAITVDTDFTVTDYTVLDFELLEAPNDFNVSINGWYWPEVDGVINTEDEIAFTFWNESDKWDMDVRMFGDPAGVVDNSVTAFLNGTGFLNEAWWVVPDKNTLDKGSYTVNATIETSNGQEYLMQLGFIIGDVHKDISPRKAIFRVGDTVSFNIEHTFGNDANNVVYGGDVKVYDPDDNLYWDGDALETWSKVATWYEVPYSAQTANNNPMVLLDDAPLGTWEYVWRENGAGGRDTIIEGSFQVEAAAEDIIGKQIEDLNSAIDDLTSDISAVTDAVAGVQSNVNSAIAAANAAVDAANAAVQAVNAVAGVAGEAATAAQNAADAATDAKNAASGLTTLVYGAIGASLVAALAAIVSLMQISRRIAG